MHSGKTSSAADFCIKTDIFEGESLGKSMHKKSAPHVGTNARLQLVLENSKSKKG